MLGGGFGDRMIRTFNVDIADAVEITAAQWGERGTRDRLRQWFARSWEKVI